MTVFIASTSGDLGSHRLAAADVIRDAQWVPIGMEHFPADPRPIVQLCRDTVAHCDLVILLQAFRQGWVPTPEQGGDGQTPITALEIAAADELGRPVLAFFANDSWPIRLCDDDPLARAWNRNFRNELNRHAKFFRWEDDPSLPLFRALLSQELANYRLRGQVTPMRAPALAQALALRVSDAEPPLPPEPYPLLGPYEHAATFAGRDSEIARLDTLVRLPPLVLCVHAPSGAGKSSLLLAGLAPRLRAEGFSVSVERAPGDVGLAQRLIRDLLVPADSVVLPDADPDLPTRFADGIAQAYQLSGKPIVLVLDQIDDVLRSTSRDRALAALGPLLAATAQRLPGIQGFGCKWILCYRHEFHGEVRGWLEDVLAQARALGRPGLQALPHDLSGPQKAHDWVLPVLGAPAPGDQGTERSTRAFLDAIVRPLTLTQPDGSTRYPYAIASADAERLAATFAQARQRQPDASLVPELQVVLNYLLQRTIDRAPGPRTIEVPSAPDLDMEIGQALRNHLERALTAAFPDGHDRWAARRARTRALLALRQLIDADGLHRAEGLPAEDLTRMLGPDGDAIIDRLSSPHARLVIATDGRYLLSHDRLAEVVADLVRNEASRGNLLLDRGLIDLQRTVGQKLALYESDPRDESALALTRSQRDAITHNHDTLLFDAPRRAWWEASQAREQRLRARQRRGITTIAAGFVGLLVLVALAANPKWITFTAATHDLSASDWTVRNGVAIAKARRGEVTVWKLDEPWSQRKVHPLPACKELAFSNTAAYVTCLTEGGDLHVSRTAEDMTLATGPVLSGVSWMVRFDNVNIIGFSRDDQWMFAAKPSGEIYVWQPADGLPQGRKPFMTAALRTVSQWPTPAEIAFSPRGTWLAVRDGSDRLFVLRTDMPPPAPAPIASVFGQFDLAQAFSDDDQWMAFGDAEPADPNDRRGPTKRNTLSVWKVGTSRRMTFEQPQLITGTPPRPFSGALHTTFSPDAKWLIGCAGSSPYVTWNIETGTPRAGIPSAGARSDQARDYHWLPPMIFNARGDWVAAIASDMRLHLWQIAKPPGWDDRPVLADGSIPPPTVPFAFSPDGTQAAAVADESGMLHTWAVGGPVGDHPVARLFAGANVAFSDDGTTLYAIDSIGVYAGRVGDQLGSVINMTGVPQTVAVLPDGQQLAVFTNDHVVLIKRQLTLWGVPLWGLRWPGLAQPLRPSYKGIIQ